MKKCSAVCWYRLLSKSQRFFASAIFLILFGAAAWAGIYKPTQMHVTPKATLEELKRGRSLYVNSCASCHTLYQPEQYDTAQWRKSMEVMSKKSKISEEEKQLILKYVTKGQ